MLLVSCKCGPVALLTDLLPCLVVDQQSSLFSLEQTQGSSECRQNLNRVLLAHCGVCRELCSHRRLADIELPQGRWLSHALSRVFHLPLVSSASQAVSSLQALTAADLNLVLYVCETVDTQQVFGQHSCPLSQPVLLSLIQQLSSDLGTRTELKLK